MFLIGDDAVKLHDAGIIRKPRNTIRILWINMVTVVAFREEGSSCDGNSE
jgi:hypothetical protein